MNHEFRPLDKQRIVIFLFYKVQHRLRIMSIRFHEGDKGRNELEDGVFHSLIAFYQLFKFLILSQFSHRDSILFELLSQSLVYGSIMKHGACGFKKYCVILLINCSFPLNAFVVDFVCFVKATFLTFAKPHRNIAIGIYSKVFKNDKD